MSFLLAFGLIVFAGIGYMFFAAFLGGWGIIIYFALLAAGVIAALFNAWSRLSQRLDRIEKALGIEEPPEEKEQYAEQAPDNSLEEI